MKLDNLLLLTDSYKLGHHKMYPEGTKNIYSYFESRNGAKFDETVFFGLQAYLKKYFEGVVVTSEKIAEAERFNDEHFMGAGEFNKDMWEYIRTMHNGMLPIKIKAVPEGTPVTVSNVMMTVEVTDEFLPGGSEVLLAPLTNALETILTHVWYPSTVASMGRHIKKKFISAFKKSVDPEDYWMVDFMLHDFGFRGVSSVESAMIGGMAHLVNFKGTDTVPAINYARVYYNSDEMLGYSVNATEHSVMTSKGVLGEFDVVRELIKNFPTGILSVVSDSYDIVKAVEMYGTELKDNILNRDGKFVVRPDSPRFEGDTPRDQIVWIAKQLDKYFGSTINSKGYKVLNPKVGIIYGDGLSMEEIFEAVDGLLDAGFSASSCLYGMGGGLLQKVNRDTQRFAFKCSARNVKDVGWVDVFKKPKDESKSSKAGRLKLITTSLESMSGKVEFKTVREDDVTWEEYPDMMDIVFYNGVMINTYNFDDIRKNSEIPW